MYNVSRDDIFGIVPPRENPACIEERREEVKRYMEQADSIVGVICASLENALRLAPGSFSSLQPIEKPSGTALRLLRYETHVSPPSFSLASPARTSSCLWCKNTVQGADLLLQVRRRQKDELIRTHRHRQHHPSLQPYWRPPDPPSQRRPRAGVELELYPPAPQHCHREYG